VHIFVSRVSTRNFDFVAYGKTKYSAEIALRKVFEDHIARREGTYTLGEMVNDVYTQEVTLGTGYVE
jgi:hypothetical protein